MPDLPSFRDCVTSAALLPIEETIPRPVTTTLFMALGRCPGRCRVLGEADLHVGRFISKNAVGGDEAVSHAHHEAAQDHALHVDVIGELLYGGRDHAVAIEKRSGEDPEQHDAPRPAPRLGLPRHQREQRQARREVERLLRASREALEQRAETLLAAARRAKVRAALFCYIFSDARRRQANAAQQQNPMASMLPMMMMLTRGSTRRQNKSRARMDRGGRLVTVKMTMTMC